MCSSEKRIAALWLPLPSLEKLRSLGKLALAGECARKKSGRAPALIGSHAGPFRTPRVGDLVHTAEGGQHTPGLRLSSAQPMEAPAPRERSED